MNGRAPQVVPREYLIKPSRNAFDAFSFSWRSPEGILAEAKLPQLSQLSQLFEAERENFLKFIKTVGDGLLLQKVLSLANDHSFLDGALGRLRETSKYGNMLEDLLRGHHMSWSSYCVHLPSATIFYEALASIPIEDNQFQIHRANNSLQQIDNLVGNADLLKLVGNGLTEATISETGTVLAHGLEISLQMGSEVVPAQKISPNKSTIDLHDRTFYNGLPGDRARFPTFVVPEGTAIKFTVKNTSKSTFMILPTINGIPTHIERLVLDATGFNRSSLPVAAIGPHIYHFQPGHTESFSGFQVDQLKLGPGPKTELYSDIDQSLPSLLMLAPYVRELCHEALSDGYKEILASCPTALQEQLRLAHQLRFLGDFLSGLREARKTEIRVSRPVIADGLASSELSNPMLGTLGLAVIELRPLPVQPEPETSSSGTSCFPWDDSLKSGASRTFGGAGLAIVTGGSDIRARAASPNFLTTDNATYHFVGYIPMNLMSAK
jgi:hypothetical protein